jgi:D-glycero-D-manno-heptose 1,7-bisphosphate phosphatase
MRKKYVFIDRDGVINVEGEGRTPYGYITAWEDFEFLPGVLEGLRKLTEAGYRNVVISNQKCVGRGIMTRQELDVLTAKMREAVEKEGGRVDEVFYCTHLDEDNCHCRKPKDGLFIEAREKLGLADLEDGYFIGDSERDIIAGRSAGLKTILVLSGKSGRGDEKAWTSRPDHICENFLEAVEVVMEER